jgi:alpha-glucosidase (family GH31 glycosyl hydrolase)
MPIFIREGAIIPKQPSMQYVNEKPISEITLAIYPSSYSSYELYEDDGITDDYKQGIYAITHIESRLNNGTWTLDIHKPQGKFSPSKHTYSVEVYWEEKPLTVSQNGHLMQETTSDTKEGWYYDEVLRRVIIKSNLLNQKDIEIKIN